MIRRNVTTFREGVHVLKCDLCGVELSRGGLGASEPPERVRSFADQLDTTFRAIDGFGVSTKTTEHEARAVQHHQVARFVLERHTRESIRFVKTTRMIRTPDNTETRDDCERIEIASGVCFAQRLAEATFHREL